MMELVLIVAADEGNVIGKGGQIPWKLLADWQRMSAMRKGHPIIMGRKTHESINKVLAESINIVVTRNGAHVLPGANAVSSLEEGINFAKASGAKQAFIFGGEQLYRESMPLADRIELTRVHTRVEGGDTFFPEIPAGEWTLVKSEDHEADEKNQFPFTFETYERKR